MASGDFAAQIERFAKASEEKLWAVFEASVREFVEHEQETDDGIVIEFSDGSSVSGPDAVELALAKARADSAITGFSWIGKPLSPDVTAKWNEIVDRHARRIAGAA